VASPREIRVRSFGELHDQLFADDWSEELHRFRSSFAFRGLADAACPLRPVVSRLGRPLREVETPLLRTYRKYARRLVEIDDSVWSWLAVAQHHGLPTRLLDWTFSPYVALHFVTESVATSSVDGVVWAIDYVRARERLPGRLARVLAEEEANVFTAEMLERAVPSLRELDALGDSFVVFFEPPSLDERIVNQYALFSLMAGEASLERWVEANAELVRRIVVPASLKWEVRDKLDQANITERVLFPGLDGLSRWLSRYYAARE
jgi:hypothetical protein